ncbi:uncharacterized protein TNCV_3192031 [Trichonephila clavipes]|nr:uncharacterized protein TNCV_3192031 [Trichonephila clavipes]
MRNKEDLYMRNLLMEEMVEELQEQRNQLRQDAKRNIQKIQAENKRAYDRKRKKAPRYQKGDLVAIQRTQFGSALKLRPKFLEPYKIIEVKPRDRLVESFFKNDEGHNVTVNGDRYRAKITNFFIPELNNHDVQELWFQQDGATCHTARATIDLLKDTFGDRLISRFGPVNWPPRSCDLTPLDYFLWGYVMSLIYADKPQTLDHLEDNIRRVIADIRPQMLEKIIENWTSRLGYIRAIRGNHMPEIIFKM